jgi:integrase
VAKNTHHVQFGSIDRTKAVTRNVIRNLVSRVLGQAVTDGLIATNPATRIAIPTSKRKPIRILELEEIERLADAIDDRYRAAIMLSAYGGLRFAEIAGLRRSALRLLERRVDITEGAVEVRGRVTLGPLKTPQSRRTVTIPSFLAEDLAAHLTTHTDELVFPAPSGRGPIHRSTWRPRFWMPAVKTAGLTPPPTFHHLRHTAAALAIAHGAHPKAIQARLGHASITTTLNLYGHLFPGLDEDLADRLGDARAARLRHAHIGEVVPLGSKRG